MSEIVRFTPSFGEPKSVDILLRCNRGLAPVHTITFDCRTMQKRQLDQADAEGDSLGTHTSVLKRAKLDGTSTDLVRVPHTSQALTLSRSAEPGRTSALMAPEVSLLGHEGAVYSIDFDPSGLHLCSGSYDKQICKLPRVNETSVVAIS
jgi:hypothetical protein